MSVAGIKRNDTVVGISGVNKGKTGKVLHVFPKTGRAIVEGLNIVKKTLRKSQDNPQGGISEKEAPLRLSNLMLYCSTCKKGVRITRTRDGDRPIRKCRKCGHSFDD
jgi:large subunit ribosomal protein L24